MHLLHEKKYHDIQYTFEHITHHLKVSLTIFMTSCTIHL